MHTNDGLKIIAHLRILTAKAEESIITLSKLGRYVEQIPNLITETEAHVSELSIIFQRAERLSEKLESNMAVTKNMDIKNHDSTDAPHENKQEHGDRLAKGFLNQSKYFNSLKKIEITNAT